MTGSTRSPHAVLVLVVLAAISACAPEAGDQAVSSLRHELDTVGAVVHVRIAGTPPAWTLDPVMTVGSAAEFGSPAPDEFGRITSVITDGHGAVWVADALSHDIRVFGADGGLLSRIGREGQGPGEFLAIYSLAWVGDILLVLDLGNGRVAELSPSGEWLGTRAAPGRVTGSPALLRFYAIDDTTVYQWSLKPASGRAERVWIEHRPSGVTAEWPQLRLDPPQPPGVLCNTPDGSISFFEMPFGGRLLQYPAGPGLTYVAWTRDYRIALLDAKGDTVRVIERERPKVPITDGEWDAARSEYAAFVEKWPGATCDPSEISRPDSKPAFRNLLLDTSGRLWVEAYTEIGLVWEVFDREGILRGVTPSFDYVERVAPSIRGDLLAWVEADSLGVQRVRMARVGGGPSF